MAKYGLVGNLQIAVRSGLILRKEAIIVDLVLDFWSSLGRLTPLAIGILIAYCWGVFCRP
ncbi:MAG: hypothetical protein CMJ50_05720 [Planctomycetaceae bacterium]|nr:hypothetical protein [Planctomycetaceae bacterium]